ncbi:MAG: hypothetical protein NZU63_01500 [Gemmataceae bacterium]|nr:hypothetical protein [Gemmataceae bacterium]
MAPSGPATDGVLRTGAWLDVSWLVGGAGAVGRASSAPGDGWGVPDGTPVPWLPGVTLDDGGSGSKR